MAASTPKLTVCKIKRINNNYNPTSIVFFGSMKEDAISSILSFSIRKLIVRYLGVPLIAKRLRVKDYGPKDHGGLGVKDLKTWNYALLAKNVWNIATKKDSLWVKWIYFVKLRGKIIWEVKEDNEDSWGWKNLLVVRDQIRDNVKYKVGNDSKTSLWFDN
nr:RNA-directed DNA polymerase, eukaryota, reverse transcriptase zinc-binding domain protein [Tanacetum cinerariifolium]